ncbi:MAG TPA: hypothetical protein VI172_10820 [Candidatus Dormibacteraeota bacterium]
MYVVKFSEDNRTWTFFANRELALEWLSSYPPSSIRPELNLQKGCG